MLLAEHIYLIIGKSTMEGKFRITRDTLMFKYMLNGSPRQATSYLRNTKHRQKPGNWPASRMCPCDSQEEEHFVPKKHGASAAPPRD